MLWQFTLIFPTPHIIMRKITKEAYWAFRTEQPFKRGNTEVRVLDDRPFGCTTKLYLHGNLIAYKDRKDGLSITNAGYFTNVTKERLNSLPNVNIVQKNGEWFLNGELWDGEWKRMRSYRYV